MVEAITKKFNELYGTSPQLYSSPGRVNLIGEHTDYNNGFVLPAAVNRAVVFALAPNGLNKLRFYAIDLNEQFETDTSNIEKSESHWANYLLGVMAQFTKQGKTLPGIDCVFGGNVPLGAGMSSSASIECGMAYALNDMFNMGFDSTELVAFAQKAEHDYAGVQCGIMDQFAVMHGKKDKVIKLDCQSLEYELFPLKMEKHMLVLVNTGVKHSLASSEYNTRRRECEQGVTALQQYDVSIQSLRDVSPNLIHKHKNELPPVVYKRCSYVIEENERVQLACECLMNNNLQAFGKYMYASHAGLRDKYQVSCHELDMLVDIASQTPGVLGARMMGGGFGGCTINLVEKEHVSTFTNSINKSYQTPDGKAPQIIEVVIADGTKKCNRYD